MGDADGGDSSVMGYRTSNAVARQKTLKQGGETFGLPDHSQRRRPEPGLQLGPGFFRRTRGVLPNFSIGYDAEEFVDTRPRDGPGTIRSSESLQEFQRGCVFPDFTPMGINQNVGINRNHGSAASIDLITQVLPAQLLERVPASRLAHTPIRQPIAGTDWLFLENQADSFFNHHTQRFAGSPRMALCSLQKWI